jgi:hypothetical protein
LRYPALLALDPPNLILQSITLPQLWSVALCALGYQYFTGKGLVHSATVTLAPYVLIFGTWALISAL